MAKAKCLDNNESMSQSQRSVKVDIATEQQTIENRLNQEFVNVWHRAAKDEITNAEDNLYFLEPAAHDQNENPYVDLANRHTFT